MLVLFIIILPFFSNCCNLIIPEYTIYGSTLERNSWDIQKFFMNGELMSFSLNGDDGLHFSLEQPVHEVDQETHYSQISQQMYGLDVLRESQSKFWLNQFAFLDVNQIFQTLQQKNISPKFTNRIEMNIQEGMQCVDLKYLDQNTFIVCCKNQEQYSLITILNSIIIDQKVIPLLQSYSEVRIQIQRNGGSMYLFIGLFHPELSQIETYQINSSLKISELIDTLNLERLNIYLRKKINQFHMVEFQSGINPQIYLLDQNVGLIKMKIDIEGKWDYLYQYTLKDIVLYETFDVLRQYGNLEYIKVLAKNKMGQYMLCNSNTCEQYNLINNQRYQLYLSKNYNILCTYNYVFIYSESNLIFQQKKTNYKILVNQFTDQFIIFQQGKSQLFAIHSGRLIQNIAQVKQTQIKYFNLIGISKIGKCVCQIRYQIYDFRDSRIQQSISSKIENELTIFYPQYPEINILMESEVSGPLIEIKSIINLGMSPEISYLYGYRIKGMEKQEIENFIYYDILQSQFDFFHYHLIQIDDYSVYIYLCQKQDEFNYDLLCTNQYNFQLTYQITRNSIQWTNSVDLLYGMYFAYYFQQLHQISIYSLIAKSKTLVYTIKTSIQDESNQITQFIIINQYVYVFLQKLKLIQIHSIKTKQIIYYINEELMIKQGILNWNPTQIIANNVHNPELLFIRNEEILIIGYFFDEFTLLQTLPLLNDYCEVDLAISQNTIVIAQLDSNQAIIQEYEIVDFNTILFKKNYPIYSNILQQPLSLYYNSVQSIFYVLAFSQVKQQTVFLVYSTLQSMRQSLLTTIQVGEYIPITDGKIMFAVGGQNEIYLKILKQIKRLIQFTTPRMTMEPPNISHDLYKIDGVVKKSYFNQDYPLTLELSQKIVFINLQTALKWIPLNEIYLDNQNIIQYILIKDSQIIGQWINLQVQCVQCGSSKFDLVFLKDKLELIDEVQFDFAIKDMIVMMNQVVVLKYNQLIMLNNKTKYFIDSKIDGYEAQRLYYLDELLVIVLDQQNQGTLLQFYEYTDELQYLGFQLLLEVQIMKILKYQDYLIILHCNNQVNQICTQNSSIIYLYLINGDQLNYLELKYILNGKYFQQEYCINDIILTKQLLLIATESNSGLLVIQLEYFNNILKPEKTIKLIDVNKQVIQQNINLIQNDQYLQILEIKENQYILTTRLSNAYGIILNPGIQIIFLILKYGIYQRSSQMQYANNKLILNYNNGNNYNICLYQIPDIIQFNINQSFETIICKGGLSFINQNMETTRKYIFFLNYENNQLLLNLAISKQYSKLFEYKINEDTIMIINNVTEYNEKQTIELVVSNSFEQSVQKIQIKQQIQPIPEENLLMEYFWFLLIIVIILIIILVILVCTKCKKKTRRKRKSKTINLNLN